MGIERMHEFWPEWKIIELLGEGSYGKVYKAVREDHSLTTFSAIKIISVPKNQAEIGALHSEGMTDSESKEYLEGVVSDFITEIKLMETLKGTANIVSVEDYRILEKKNNEIGWDIYIRMELLRSFADQMAKGSLSEEETLKLGIDICSALELCSKNNIIHRDIKPANIFISKNGDYKLGDFGVAKELGKTSSAMSSKGTYSYMAPEVADRKNYDSTVDIYSLGIVMYTLLNNNRQPFTDPNALQVSYNDRMAATNMRLSGKPLPPPCNANKNLAEIILTACAFEPAKRFRSATAFKNALVSYRNSISAAQNDPDRTIAVAHKAQSAQAPSPAPKPAPQPAPKPAPQPAAQRTPQVPYTPLSAPPAQQPPKKKKKKTGLIIAIILIVLALFTSLIVGAVLVIPKIIDSFDSQSSYSVKEDDDKSKDTEEPETEPAQETYSEPAQETYSEAVQDTSSAESDQPADDDLYWAFNDGVLEITGTGAMPDFTSSEETPWYEYLNDITSIVIGEGVTKVGDYSFDGCYNCMEITLASSLRTIGYRSFAACGEVIDLDIPEGVEVIAESAFQSCWAVTSISIPETVESIGSWAFSFAYDLSSVFVFTDDAEFGDYVFGSDEDCAAVIHCLKGSTAETYAKANNHNCEVY